LGPDEFGAPAGEIEDLAEPILAYRWWRLRWCTLASMRNDITWPTAKLGGIEGRCENGHGCPCNAGDHEYGYGCGIYAVREPRDLFARRWGGNVCGEVLLGGRVQPHRRGYRAQYATVRALYLPPRTEGHRRR
jgi:hypothetical protein